MIAHRGACRAAPENSLLAFRLARSAGADGVELDVMRCASGEIVVCHDFDLRRVAGRTERIAALPLAALREVALGHGQTIPTLAEVLEEIGPGMLINVEIKSQWRLDARLVISLGELLRHFDATGRVLVSSFHPLALLLLRRLEPAIPTGLLFARDQRLPLRQAWAARALRPFALHPDRGLVDPLAVDAWRRRGYAIHPWTVDEPHEVAALVAMGVDALITNEPARVRAIIDGDE